MAAVTIRKGPPRREMRGVIVPLQNADIIRRCSNILGHYDGTKFSDVVEKMLEELGIDPIPFRSVLPFQKSDNGGFLIHQMQHRNVTLVLLPT